MDPERPKQLSIPVVTGVIGLERALLAATETQQPRCGLSESQGQAVAAGPSSYRTRTSRTTVSGPKLPGSVAVRSTLRPPTRPSPTVADLPAPIE